MSVVEATPPLTADDSPNRDILKPSFASNDDREMMDISRVAKASPTNTSTPSIVEAKPDAPQKEGHNEGYTKANQRRPTEMILMTNWRIVRLITIVIFIIRIQYTVYFASMKPMLNQMDQDMDQSSQFYGWFCSFYSVGVAISGPLFGFAANKFGFLRPALLTFALMFAANVGYILLWNVPEGARWYALVLRFLHGIAAGGSSILNTYWVTVTKSKDAATAAAYTDGAMSLGIAFGPLVQLICSYGPEPRRIVLLNFVHINMYSIPAMLAIILVLLATVLFYWSLDGNEEKRVVVKESSTAENCSKVEEDAECDLPSLNYTALVLCFAFRAVQQILYSNMETNNPSFMAWMFSYSDTQTTQVGSAVVAGSGLVGFGFLVVYVWSGMAKKVANRIGVLVSFVICLIFLLGSFPYPFYNGFIDHQKCTYPWCRSTPTILLPLYIVVYLLLLGVGFPLMNVHSSALLAKQLEGRKQAHWHGISNFIGTASRIAAGPLMAKAFQHKGIIFTWYVQIGMVVPMLVIVVLCYNRLGSPLHLSILPLFKRVIRKEELEQEKKPAEE